jgi:arginyl-tRNA synthetase
MIKWLAQYPTVVEGSALALEPHRLTFYLQDLAAQLHAYYNKHRVLPPQVLGNEASEGVIPTGVSGQPGESEFAENTISMEGVLSPALTAARLVLMKQVQTVLRNGLTLLGLSSPEKM